MMFSSCISVFSLVLLVSIIECKILPKYVKRCSTKDPEAFSKCALESAKGALPHILNGDKEYKLQKLNPLKIPLLQLNAGPSLNLTLTNQNVEGLPTVDFKSIKFDKATRKVSVDMFFDFISLRGEYSVEGEILILPILGSGKGFTNFKKAHLSFTFTINLVKNNKGEEVIKVENPNLETDFGGVEFKLDNLFNGDKVLGDEMNRFLNENWKEVITEFQDIVKSPMNGIMTGIANGLLNNLRWNVSLENA